MLWLDRQSAESLFVTTVSMAETLVGLERLPMGRRRARLETIFSELMRSLFGGRILPFDEPAARAFPALIVKAASRGATIGFADGQIAAIARAKGFIVATRDVAPFEAAGVETINPWEC